MKILMIGPDFSVVGGMTSLNRMIMEEKSEQFTVRYSPSMNTRSLIGRVVLWGKNLVSAPIIRITNPPDIVHIHVSSGLSIWRKTSIGNLWSILGVPVVYHTHGSKIKDFINKSSRISRHIIGRRFRRARLVVTLSEGWRDWYSETLGLDIEKVTVLPTPIKIPIEERIAKNGDDILYSGLMGDRKGTFDLIRAWYKIPEEVRKRAKLHLIGNGKVERAANLAGELGLGGSCIVHGWVSEEEKERLMRECGIYVLPSYNEGLPMGLLEAMAWGLTPISSNVGAIPEVISNGENGLLIEPGDVDGLSKIIRNLIEDTTETRRLANNARKSAMRHDWRRYVERLNETWEEMLR